MTQLKCIFTELNDPEILCDQELEEAVEEILHRADTNWDGYVEMTEFITAMAME